MKIGNGNGTQLSNHGDLFGRMEEAHREGKLDASAAELRPAGPEDSPSARAAASAGATRSAGASGWEQLQGPLQKSLLQTAERAMQGQFDSENHARNAVVETIVDQRYAEDLQPGQAERIMQTLSATLVTDPAFCREVDHMLLLAARELARSNKAGGA